MPMVPLARTQASAGDGACRGRRRNRHRSGRHRAYRPTATAFPPPLSCGRARPLMSPPGMTPTTRQCPLPSRRVHVRANSVLMRVCATQVSPWPKRVDHEQRRRQIGEALLRVASTRGLQSATMREVAAEAGVSLRLVQYYFHSSRTGCRQASGRSAGSPRATSSLARSRWSCRPTRKACG